MEDPAGIVPTDSPSRRANTRHFRAWATAAVAVMALLAVSAATAAADAVSAPADLERGRKLYARCVGCHSLDRNAMGPRHCGVVGRAAGTVPEFNYSPAMRKSDIVWTAEALEAFLANPAAAVPGTTMRYAGIPLADERRDIVAWLEWAAQHEDRCQPVRKETGDE